ncbi:MAG: transcription/translation regulatory transformer protein RfaH [Halomonas sp.]|nr:transcription/translation regulatory transformer protein RfaH [Halomonas sp.]MDN6298497.1 transcription/translation regulatory transformer protein RfaH [Halomonas sp.]MDN6315516.1 transcription/translation regulatory transformer protein RfaH [Halomonas sp.]MDN6336441.1 transcription/translation regulatory transformer protein RfaH [Halomonas sp.]
MAQCKAGESFRAAEHLGYQGYQVFHPVLNVQRRRRGKLTSVCEPLFPFYLFIYLDQINSNWRPIRSTRGVLRIIRFGNTPAAVPHSLIERLRHHPHETEGVHTRFCAGDKITIAEGPFKGLDAIFQRAKGEERAIILLNMLQHQRAIEVPNEHLI